MENIGWTSQNQGDEDEANLVKASERSSKGLVSHEAGSLRALVKNFSFLLTGNTLESGLGLVSWTLTARALGADVFGTLVLIQTYVLTIDALVNFQSWQATIRYGTEAMERQREGELADTIKFGLLVDISSALTGTLLATGGAYLFARWQQLGGEHLIMLLLYCGWIIFNIKGTPTAVLRMFDEFSRLAWQQSLKAITRALAVVVIFFYQPTLWGFLLAWLLTEIGGSLLLLAMGLHQLYCRELHVWRNGSARSAINRHPGILRFVLTTNLNSSVKYGGKQLDVLLSGALITPAAAGVLKIIKLFVKVIGALSAPLDQTIYPDLSRLWTSGKVEEFRRYLVRAGVMGGAIGIAVWIGVLVTGPWILGNVFGQDYQHAYVPLLVYLAPSALSLFAIGFRSALLSMEKVKAIFIINLIGYGTYLLAMPLLISQLNILGAALAQFIHNAVWVGATGYLVFDSIHERSAEISSSIM